MRPLRFVLTLLLALPLTPPSAHGATIHQPGYTDTTLGSVIWGPSGSNYGLAVDSANNLYIAGRQSNEVWVMTPGGSSSLLVTTPDVDPLRTFEGSAFSLLIDGGTLYVGHNTSGTAQWGDGGRIYAYDLANPTTPTLVAEANENPHPGVSVVGGMAFAPNTWGPYGDQLVVTTYWGVDVFDAGGNRTNVYNTSPQAKDMAFTPGGDLLVAAGTAIWRVDPDGTRTQHFTTTGQLTGIAVHPVTGAIYVADTSNDVVLEVAADGSSHSVFASGVSFGSSFYLSDLIFSADGGSLYYGASVASGKELHRIDGFQTVASPVPEPSAALLALAGLLALGLRRR